MEYELLKIIIYLTLWIPLIFISPRTESGLVAFVISVYIHIMTLMLVGNFDCSKNFQFEETVEIIPEYGLWLSLGVDGISLSLLILTTGLIPICIFACMFFLEKSKELIIQILFIELLLIISFTTTNLFFFL